ncbi:methyl-accepting chemotaxis protein [Thermococcus sp.]|uniref:methyl-accepting chemotaxis protein n=1 Tax=Thermococcus sp. TaxID=35749 RepID=UPI00262BE353|nr:methyl-accepting chemotaxis protein [Thermococcus sp.]
MNRITVIASVASVSVLTLLGALWSPLAGLALGLASVLPVAFYVMRPAEGSGDALTAVEKLLLGETPDLSGFDRNTTERLLKIEDAIDAIKRRRIEVRHEGAPKGLEEALNAFEEVHQKLSSLVPSLSINMDADEADVGGVLEKERSTIAELGDYIQTLTAGIEEMNTQSQALTDYALETANMAEKGKQISDNVALNVASINEVNQDMERAVSILLEHSKRIGEIVEVIGSIAEQTNLLALNAAIEAARSGEHGRGFAVVAENIRELADQSKQSTDQIANLVMDMKESIDTVVSSIKQEFKVTEEIKDAVQELIAAFDDIARRANETANMIKELSDSIEGQAQSVQMLMDTLDGVYSLQDEVSNAITPVVGSFSGVQSKLDEIRNGLKDLERSIVESREILEKVAARR